LVSLITFFNGRHRVPYRSKALGALQGILMGLVFLYCLCHASCWYCFARLLSMLWVFKNKKNKKQTIIALSIFVLLVIIQLIVLPGGGSYFDQFNNFGVRSVIKSFLVASKSLIFFWGTYPQAIFLGFIIALLALLGFIRQLKKEKISV